MMRTAMPIDQSGGSGWVWSEVDGMFCKYLLQHVNKNRYRNSFEEDGIDVPLRCCQFDWWSPSDCVLVSFLNKTTISLRSGLSSFSQIPSREGAMALAGSKFNFVR